MATATNIDSQPLAIQQVYSNLLAEVTQWENAVATDTDYRHASAPAITLSTTNTVVTNAFEIHLQFSESVEQLSASDLVVSNGSTTMLQGSGSNYSATISPAGFGTITVQLPAGAAIDSDGNTTRIPINSFLEHENPNRATFSPPHHHQSIDLRQTVDAQDDVPGDDDNNLEKFTAGTINDGTSNPYTTTLYARSSTVADRRYEPMPILTSPRITANESIRPASCLTLIRSTTISPARRNY